MTWKPRLLRPAAFVLLVLLLAGPGKSADKPSAERGRAALLQQAFSPSILSEKEFGQLWKVWGLKQKPADYERLLRERYGLHVAPYDNRRLPMGFRESRGLFGKGLTNDCLLCHAGSIAGQSYIGVPNTSLDLQGLFDDLFVAAGFTDKLPLTFSNVRGTIEAVASVAYLMEFRDADLNVHLQQKMGYRCDLCEDIPAWWHLKKKKTMYHTGSVDSRSVRSIMTFMLSPLNTAAYIKKQEPVFADIRAYLLTLVPPKYPFPIDASLAARGKDLFAANCAKCHGTYGPGGVYPNKVIPLDIIGTDRGLAEGYTPRAAEHYLKSWFAQEKDQGGEPYLTYTDGYQCPPLDGIWATAPYFHNASAATVYHVLNSRARPKIFTRSYRTEKDDYDTSKLGWKIQVLEKPPDASVPPAERRKIYDTTQPGRSNNGHPFGDKLTDPERFAIIEYLKTL